MGRYRLRMKIHCGFSTCLSKSIQLRHVLGLTGDTNWVRESFRLRSAPKLTLHIGEKALVYMLHPRPSEDLCHSKLNKYLIADRFLALNSQDAVASSRQTHTINHQIHTHKTIITAAMSSSLATARFAPWTVISAVTIFSAPLVQSAAVPLWLDEREADPLADGLNARSSSSSVSSSTSGGCWPGSCDDSGGIIVPDSTGFSTSNSVDAGSQDSLSTPNDATASTSTLDSSVSAPAPATSSSSSESTATDGTATDSTTTGTAQQSTQEANTEKAGATEDTSSSNSGSANTNKGGKHVSL